MWKLLRELILHVLTTKKKGHYICFSTDFSHQLFLQRRRPKACACVCMCVCTRMLVHAQLCSTLCNSMDCSQLVSSVHGLLQARTLEWVAISYFRGSSWHKAQIHIQCIQRHRASRRLSWDTKPSVQSPGSNPTSTGALLDSATARATGRPQSRTSFHWVSEDREMGTEWALWADGQWRTSSHHSPLPPSDPRSGFEMVQFP